jgi:hypothetical protein
MARIIDIATQQVLRGDLSTDSAALSAQARNLLRETGRVFEEHEDALTVTARRELWKAMRGAAEAVVGLGRGSGRLPLPPKRAPNTSRKNAPTRTLNSKSSI